MNNIKSTIAGRLFGLNIDFKLELGFGSKDLSIESLRDKSSQEISQIAARENCRVAAERSKRQFTAAEIEKVWIEVQKFAGGNLNV